jgi:DNA-binding CsgD family transcriptional regulator/tetratricopeptide (TPR) repeat protein
MDDIFVGRGQQIARLKAALDDAVHTRARVVSVSGEAGIGKTRTIQEFAAYAAVHGFQVHWGGCLEGQGTPAYWPWTQILRSIAASASDEQMPGLNDLIDRLSRGSSSSGAAYSEDSRAYLFDMVHTCMNDLAQTHPLVLILEDFHWADVTSLLLLEYLSSELRLPGILLVCTFRVPPARQQTPLRSAIAHLLRAPGHSSIRLNGLHPKEVETFVGSRVGFTPPPAVTSVIHERSEGNPFFMVQLVQVLIDEAVLLQASPDGNEPDWTSQAWQLELPEGVVATIGRRLSYLSNQCRDVLTIAAVGREFDTPLLAQLLPGTTLEDLLLVLEEAEAARIIEEVRGVAGRYQFAHVLFQEAIYSMVSTARRMTLHQRIANVLEDYYASELEQHAGELADQFERAGIHENRENYIRYTIMAGECALRAFAYEEAEARFNQVLRLETGTHPGINHARCWFGLGRAFGATGRVLDAWSYCEQAFRGFVDAGEYEAAIETARYPLFYVPGVEQPTGMVAEALGFAEPDSLQAGQLLNRYGLLRNLETADEAGANRALNEALRIAQSRNNAFLGMQVRMNLADVAWYHLRHEEAISQSRSAIQLCRRLHSPLDETWARYLAGSSALFVGDLELLDRQASAMITLARQNRVQGYLGQAYLLNAILNYGYGNLARALDWCERGLRTAPDLYILVTLDCLLRFEAGDTERGARGLDYLLTLMRRTPPGPFGEYVAPAIVIPSAARIIDRPIEDEMTGVVRSAASVVLSSKGRTPRAISDAHLGLALLAIHQRDRETCSDLYDQLLPFAGTISPYLISINQVIGLLAHYAGKTDEAKKHLQAAIERLQTSGYVSMLAWTRFDLAEVLISSGEDPGSPTAHQLLHEALTSARAFGMKALAGRSEKLLADIEPRPATMAGAPYGLTRRELEVLCLVASGRSDREIAEQLFISHHTVMSHVSSILGKIGVESRTAATAEAIRQQII